jgi:carboxypeptidase C (cathepsin A)
LFADAILQHHDKSNATPSTTINLHSVMIGNGFSEAVSMERSYYDMSCTGASINPVVDARYARFWSGMSSKLTQFASSCSRMKSAAPRCEKGLKNDCSGTPNPLSCETSYQFCQEELELPLILSGVNPYDLSKMCDGPIESNLCYPITE